MFSRGWFRFRKFPRCALLPRSMIIATHIHVSNGGGGTNGANGEGPPVINFCGSNRPGMVDDNTPYPQEPESVRMSWRAGSLGYLEP